MRLLTVTTAVAVLLSIALCGTAKGDHSCWDPLDIGNPCFRWPVTQLPFTIAVSYNFTAPALGTEAEWIQALDNAIAAWSDTTGTCSNSLNPVRLVRGESIALGCSPIVYQPGKIHIELCDDVGVNGTTSVDYKPDGTILAAFIKLETAVQNGVDPRTPRGQHVLSHELGHALGLEHTADDTLHTCGRGSCMYTSPPAGFANYQYPSPDDYSHLVEMYPDNFPPAQSPFLLATGTCDSLIVEWQTTGDDGNVGTATSFDLRLKTTAITTDASFNSASKPLVTLPAPGPPGTYHRVAIYVGTCSARKYFAIKIKDDVGNKSALKFESNGAQSACPTPPLSCEAEKMGPRKEVPARTEILEFWPNPSTGSLSVELSVASAESGRDVEINVFDVAGRTVKTLRSGNLAAGRHTLQWDGRDDKGRAVGSGIYFARASGVIEFNKRFVISR